MVILPQALFPRVTICIVNNLCRLIAHIYNCCYARYISRTSVDLNIPCIFLPSLFVQFGLDFISSLFSICLLFYFVYVRVNCGCGAYSTTEDVSVFHSITYMC